MEKISKIVGERISVVETILRNARELEGVHISK
jgi:hypothetical protein